MLLREISNARIAHLSFDVSMSLIEPLAGFGVCILARNFAGVNPSSENSTWVTAEHLQHLIRVVCLSGLAQGHTKATLI